MVMAGAKGCGGKQKARLGLSRAWRRPDAASGRASASIDARHHRQAACHHQTVARAAGFTAGRQVRGQAGTFMAENEMSRPESRLKRKNFFPA
jgi:hypothetical protein